MDKILGLRKCRLRMRLPELLNWYGTGARDLGIDRGEQDINNTRSIQKQQMDVSYSTNKEQFSLNGESSSTREESFPLNEDPSSPVVPDRETCCGEGCKNCVWLDYVYSVKFHFGNNKDKIREALTLIPSLNVRAFVEFELKKKVEKEN